jgi:hypothetical protein
MATKTLSEKLSIPATATCPQCKNEAKWDSYKNRYVCRAKKEVNGKEQGVHGYDGYTFTNNVGVCEATNRAGSGFTHTAYCDRVGAPEPATKDGIDYANGGFVVIQIENKDWNQKPLEGLFYCGVHSPSRKAAKEVAKSIEENRSRKAAVESKEARVVRETQAVNEAATLLELLVDTTTPSDDMRAAIKLLKEKALDQITRKEYNSRW